jgi:beta-phosphoglucomutase-like phosphatase (HAD superfamily)
LLAAERLGVRADQCVAIEDSPTGVRSALAAGCRVIGVPHVVDIPADVADLPESVGYLTLLPTLDGLQLGDLVRIFHRMGR